jgi:uncharacterized protein (TIGR02266 family)
LRYGDLETFVQRFAPNVTRGGIFLATRTPRPPGDLFSFEVSLSTGQIALAGQGKVIWVKEFDPAAPQRPHGMGVQFVHIDPATRDTLTRILQSKGAGKGGAGGRPRNGTGPVVVVDTTVDLAAEYGLDDATLRRAVDHRWMVSGTTDNELDELLKPEPTETVTLAQALAELPRLLDPGARSRRTGAYRSLEITNTGERAPSPTEPSRPVEASDDTASSEHGLDDPLP